MVAVKSPKPARLIFDGRKVTMIGWMEMIGLPDLGLPLLKAKIDTGARTSALHATDIRVFDREGRPWVAFKADSGHGLCDWQIEAPVFAEKAIKNTSGVPEDRLVIRTTMSIGKRHWAIDLSLSDRTNMTFPMIVGRAALKNHAIAVHTRRTYLMSGTVRTAPRKELP